MRHPITRDKVLAALEEDYEKHRDETLEKIEELGYDPDQVRQVLNNNVDDSVDDATICNHAGFLYGYRRAIDEIERVLPKK